MIRTLLMFFVSCTLPAFAEGSPSFDCAKATGSVEALICGDAALAQLDRRLADRFSAAIDAASALDSGAQEAVDRLRATQRGWIGGRDDCWKAQDPRDCVENAYLMRDGALVALWMLEPPSAQATWVCDQNPANEVVTMFFDTALPSVRFERGDDIDAGHLSRTASGARYDGSFGRYIWTKGDTAIYREPDPNGAELDCVLSAQK